MNNLFLFVFNSIALGVGLAMDAFSVSLANGLHESKMKIGRMNLIAGTYGLFQFIMPLAGWLCIHTIVQYFTAFRKVIPYIALALLLYIGIEMIVESKQEEKEETGYKELGFATLIIQGIATSIDALSVGFTIADYNVLEAFFSSLIIGAVTHILCLAGLSIGKKAGTKLSSKASMVGGLILIAIGIEIFVKGVFLS